MREPLKDRLLMLYHFLYTILGLPLFWMVYLPRRLDRFSPVWVFLPWNNLGCLGLKFGFGLNGWFSGEMTLYPSPKFRWTVYRTFKLVRYEYQPLAPQVLFTLPSGRPDHVIKVMEDPFELECWLVDQRKVTVVVDASNFSVERGIEVRRDLEKLGYPGPRVVTKYIPSKDRSYEYWVFNFIPKSNDWSHDFDNLLEFEEWIVTKDKRFNYRKVHTLFLEECPE